MDFSRLERECKRWIRKELQEDAAHDIAHIERVVKNAKAILENEPADRLVVVAAAWLHDCVNLPKNDPNRSHASAMAAKKVAAFLSGINFPSGKIPLVAHAVEAHSFSAGVSAQTPEAKIVQDADRLDALGAIGIARCFAVSGKLDTPIYSPDDPFCNNREPDDSQWTLDHFYTKLFNLPDSMNTSTAKTLAEARITYMTGYIKQLAREIAYT